MYVGSIKITHFDADCPESLNSNGNTLLNQMQSLSNQRALSGWRYSVAIGFHIKLKSFLCLYNMDKSVVLMYSR